MLKYIRYLLTTMLISLCLFELIVFGIIAQKKGTFTSSYQNLIVDKYRILQSTNEKKIVMISGSSSSFGLDQRMLEEKTGYKVANLGLHGGFGHLFYSELAKENINEGDIVLLGYEYNWISDFELLGQQLIMSGIDNNIDMYKHIPVSHWKEFIGYLLKYAVEKNSYEGASGIYSREAFDSKDGQMIWLRDYAFSDFFEDETIYKHINILDENGDVYIADRAISYLSDLKHYVESRGASIYFVSPPVLYDSVLCDTDSFVKLIELEEEKIGIPYISDPTLYMFPIDLMSNDVYHCNSEGEKIRTSILIDDLRSCGAIESPTVTDMIRSAGGETFSLVDTLPERFLHKPKAINRVYRIDDEGNVFQYAEGTDYYVDYERGLLRRTETSSIPNYKEHRVDYVSGKFFWTYESGIYNPESNKNYQIMVDYDYYVSENETHEIGDKNSYLSEPVKEKLRNGEDISVILCGDSIGFGVGTNGQDIFLNYIEETLEDYYNLEVNTKQYSVSGSKRDLLFEDLPRIINRHPDVLMIEFGMNDHRETDGTSEERLDSFRNDIENAVETLQENDINIILIGFFQENMMWNGVHIDATIAYNNVLKDIADRNGIYFADVYDIFSKVGNIKPLNRDVITDYLIHPNEWGHKLYYTSIIEAFDVDGKMKPQDLEYYVFVE